MIHPCTSLQDSWLTADTVTIRSIMDSLVMVTRSSWLVLAIFCSSINWSVNIREINMQDGVWSSTCRPITQLTSHKARLTYLWYDSTQGSLGLKFKIIFLPLPTQYCKNYLPFGLIVFYFFSATVLLILKYLYFQTGTLQTECKRYVDNDNINDASFCCSLWSNIMTM